MRAAYFVIPMLPPSGNANGKAGYKQARQEFRDMVKASISGSLDRSCVYRLTYTFYGQWLTTKGKPKKRDHRNFTKLLDDLVAGALDIDDSHFFDVRDVKCESVEEYIEVQIEAI